MKHVHDFNLSAAEYFGFIFHSFEAGIVKAISSFKLRIIIIIWGKNLHFKIESLD